MVLVARKDLLRMEIFLKNPTVQSKVLLLLYDLREAMGMIRIDKEQSVSPTRGREKQYLVKVIEQ